MIKSTLELFELLSGSMGLSLVVVSRCGIAIENHQKTTKIASRWQFRNLGVFIKVAISPPWVFLSRWRFRHLGVFIKVAISPPRGVGTQMSDGTLFKDAK